jgi:HlyD family secretion protein
MKKKNNKQEILEYQPDAAEIDERPVPGKIRWVLYLILGTLFLSVVAAIVFKVDRIVVGHGELKTTEQTIVVQSLNTAVIRTINVQVGDVVEKDQVLATLDPTFAGAELAQLSKQSSALGVQIRRIRAELEKKSFSPLPEEGEEGRIQGQVLRQRQLILEKIKLAKESKVSTSRAKLEQNLVQRQEAEKQLKILRDMEGSAAKLPQTDTNYRLRVLDAQKNRLQVASTIENLLAEEKVLRNEPQQFESEWQRVVEERNGALIEEEVKLRNEFQKINEELHKARRLSELVTLRSPEKGIVLKLAERSVGSILQQAEPFITLVPQDSAIEAVVNVESKDIARIRKDDTVRVKLDAYPFQRHGTLSGKVLVISEDAASPQRVNASGSPASSLDQENAPAFYRVRVNLVNTELRNVPAGFRVMPGMKVRAEIKVGKRSVISYFLYPVIRALDEGLREP